MSTAKIEDFGEHIPGAAKHRAAYQQWADKVADVVSTTHTKASMGDCWPDAPWRKLLIAGADSEGVAMARALRERMPKAPPAWWSPAVKAWSKAATGLADLSVKIARYGPEPSFERDVIDTIDEFHKVWRNELREPSALDAWRPLAKMYAACGHERPLRELNLCHKGADGCLRRIVDGMPYRDQGDGWVYIHTKKRSVGATRGYPDIETAIDTWKNELQSGFFARREANKKPTLEVRYFRSRRRDDKYPFYIAAAKAGVKKAVIVRKLYVFQTDEEMYAYANENIDKINRQIEEITQFPSHRVGVGTPRVGPAYRGQDADADLLTETFSPRGVQFGNTMPQAERATHMNELHDALMDMSVVTGIPSDELMLDGDLALAFGARGRGGINPAKAHYESVQRVINLTRGKGAGSLAHEWWHAQDHKAAVSADFATISASKSVKSGDVRDTRFGDSPSSTAFFGLMRAIDASEYKGRCEQFNTINTRSGRLKDYWSCPQEVSARAFESFVTERLKVAGFTNEYLAEFTGFDTWGSYDEKFPVVAPNAPDGEKRTPVSSSYPYPTPEETRDLLDLHFCNVIEAETGHRPPSLAKLAELGQELMCPERNRDVSVRRELPERRKLIDDTAPAVEFAAFQGQGDMFQSSGLVR